MENLQRLRWKGRKVLKFASHDLPPVVTLRRLHVQELNAQSPLTGMADHRLHLQFSGRMIVVNAEVNFNLHTNGILNLTKDAYAYWAHVRQETRDKLIGRTKQNAPIGSAPGAASPFGSSGVGQWSNRISRPAGEGSVPRMRMKINNNLLMECECPSSDGDRIRGADPDPMRMRKTLRGSFDLG
jgi:hypothetical protein